MSEVEVELDHLRVPFEKIKFGKGIEVRGYGSVFEGTLDDQPVALKRINITNLSDIKPRILEEVRQISRFRHPNLVALLGFCDEKSNEIILVYEYVASGSLADNMRKHLNTIQRLEICLGAARGLDCLHSGVVDRTTPGIIHGDVKPSKILLQSDATESKFEAKVSNFGLSKIRPGHVLQKVDPTPAYRDPEFEVTGKVTKESDVYSLGVVLLEVLCGVPELVDTDDYQERHVTELVPKRLEQNKLRKIVHFDIRNEFKQEALETYAKIACQCVTKDPKDRPLMARVVEQLEEALRLQGGQVSYVPKFGSKNGGNDVDDEKKEEGNEVVMDLDEPEKEPEVITISREENTDDLDDKLNVDEDQEEDNGSNSNTTSDSKCGNDSVPDGNYVERAQEENADALMVNKDDPENQKDLTTMSKEEKVNENDIEDAQKENADVVMVKVDDLEKKRDVMTTSEEEKTNGKYIEDAQKEDAEVVMVNVNDPENETEVITTSKEEKTNGNHIEDAQNEKADVVMVNVNDTKNEKEVMTTGHEVNFLAENEDGGNRSNRTFPESSDDQQKSAAKGIVLEVESCDITESSSLNVGSVLDINQSEDAGKENAVSATTNLYTTEKKPEAVINIIAREGNFDDFSSDNKLKSVEKTESKRSSSTSSESSNGDGNTPSDYLLQDKSPANNATVKKRLNNSGNCCSCFASWKHFFSNRS